MDESRLDAPRDRKPWPVFGAALLIGAIVGAVWFAVTTPSQQPAPAAAAPAASAAQEPRKGDIAEVMRVEAPAVAVDSDGFPDTSATLKPGDIEVCGFGVARGSDVAAVDALQRRATEGDADALGQRIVAEMRARPDPLSQAAALAVAKDVPALVARAVATADASVYTFAMQACAFGQGADAHCRLLSIDRLAQLDAENAVPWLYAAAEAASRKEPQAEEAALYRASLAREVKHRQYAFGSLAWQALPRDWSLAERAQALVWIIGVQAAFALPAYSPAVRYCGKERQTADANRQQVCERLAHSLIDKGSTLIDYAIGRRLGANAGWPDELVERHAARLDAMQEISRQILDAPGGPVGCAAMRLGLQQLRGFAEPGERFSAEAQVARSGVSDAELLQRYRTAQRKREAEKLASAAHAASAPAEGTPR